MMAHSKTLFQENYLSKTDKNGHTVEKCCRPSTMDGYLGQCMICARKPKSSVASSAFAGVEQHAKGTKHKLVAFTLLGDPLNVQKQVPKDEKQSKINSLFTKTASVEVPTPSSAQRQLPSKPTPSTSKPPVPWLNVRDQASKAEAIYALKSAVCKYSFQSADHSKELFTGMFPDSEIAKHFSMGHSKLSYILSDGLGPYFQKKTVEDVISSRSYYTIHFDETVTNQSVKQMDVLIRFFSETSASVQVRFLTALMFGHAFADKVASELVQALKDLKLPLNHLLSLSSDGPNVNTSIKRNISEKLKAEGGSGLVDVGFCHIHAIHNAFKAGNDKFGKTALSFTIEVFYWFHMFPAREEDYVNIQENLGIEKLKFLRHVDSRWLTLLPAVLRVQQQLDALKAYFLEYIPKNEKRSTTSDRFGRIHNVLNKELKVLKVELCFLESIKPVFDMYLTAFQAPGPMIHLMHGSFCDMLKTVMGRFIKGDLFQNKSASHLLGVDVTSKSSQLPDKDLNIGEKTKKEIKQMTEGQQKLMYLAIRSFFSTTTKYLQSHLPLDNKLLRATAVLHHDSRNSTGSASKVKTLCLELPAITEVEVSQVLDEWIMYQSEQIPENWVALPIDKYWSNVCAMKTDAGNVKYSLLSKLVKCGLALPHGNADTERSLSQNKKVVTKEKNNLASKTLIGLRLTKYGVSVHGNGNPCHVPLTKSLLDHCKTAHSLYKAAKDEERKKQREDELKQQKEEEERKIQEAEQKKRAEALKKLKEQNKDLDEKIAETQDSFRHLDEISKQNTERMTQAIQSKDVTGIAVAHDFKKVTSEKISTARKELEKLNKQKRKLVHELEKYAHKKQKQ